MGAIGAARNRAQWTTHGAEPLTGQEHRHRRAPEKRPSVPASVASRPARRARVPGPQCRDHQGACHVLRQQGMGEGCKAGAPLPTMRGVRAWSATWGLPTETCSAYRGQQRVRSEPAAARARRGTAGWPRGRAGVEEAGGQRRVDDLADQAHRGALQHQRGQVQRAAAWRAGGRGRLREGMPWRDQARAASCASVLLPTASRASCSTRRRLARGGRAQLRTGLARRSARAAPVRRPATQGWATSGVQAHARPRQSKCAGLAYPSITLTAKPLRVCAPAGRPCSARLACTAAAGFR